MAANSTLNRRQFLRSTGTLTGASFLRLGVPALTAISQAACGAKQAAAEFVSFSTSEATDLAAIAARILPTTDTPGATEAGVVYFIDKAFAAEMNARLEGVKTDLIAFNDALSAAHPSADHLASLSDTDQDAFLRSVEDSGFFSLIRVMTIFGTFAMSKYGGNNGNVGWEMLNFKGAQGAWQYPFGHYDAEVHGGSYDGE